MNYKETALQMACVKWFNLQYPKALYLHPPLEGRRSYKAAATLKAMGMKKGALDLYVFDIGYNPNYRGLAVEFKDDKNDLTEEQADWAAKLKSRQWRVVLVRSIDEFIQEVNQYYHGGLNGRRA